MNVYKYKCEQLIRKKKDKKKVKDKRQKRRSQVFIHREAKQPFEEHKERGRVEKF